MNKTLEIARWEFVEKVKRKSFVISLFITPIIFIVVGLLPTFMAKSDHEAPLILSLKNKSKISDVYISKEIDALNNSLQVPKYILLDYNNSYFNQNEYSTAEQLIESNDVDIFIVIHSGDSINIYKKFGVNTKYVNNIRGQLNKILWKARSENLNISNMFIEDIFKENNVEIITVSKTSQNLMNLFVTSYILLMILIMMILTSGGMMVRSLIEEKSNRIIEILLSSCTNTQILFGKVIGLTSLGVFQLLIWGSFAAVLKDMNILPLFDSKLIFLQLVYFLLGYTFYSSLFIGVAGIVNTEHAAQQFTGYITIILIMPIILSIQIINNPESMLSKIFSYFPLTTSPFMILRTNIYTPDLWEIILTILILFSSIIISIKFSAKLFKIGMLYYGRFPKLSELKKWLKTN